MRLNVKPSYQQFTHESAPAFPHLTAEQALRRSVLSSLLWERQFYEDGQEIAARIQENATKVAPDVLAALAVEAREKFHLRHTPLLLLSILARTGKGSSLVSETITRTIQRADELAEFLVVYAQVNGVTPDKLKPKLSAQVKKGLGNAFKKFNQYALTKYDRADAVRLRDVLFLTHPSPDSVEQAELWRGLVDGTLPSPETWEVALSSGADKKETFERLLREGNLGYMALLRNLRNMAESGVDRTLVRNAIIARKGAQRVLPFRYVAAARAAPQFEPYLDQALSEAIAEMPVLSGTTAILVDVSGSMDDPISAKSDLKRIDAAAALASIVHGNVRVFTFSHEMVEVPPRRGMAGVDVVIKSQPHGGTYLGAAVHAMNKQVPHDRLIVITDEQSHDRVPDPVSPLSYLINVASHRNGVGYGKWCHIDGFSEQVLRFIVEHEAARTL